MLRSGNFSVPALQCGVAVQVAPTFGDAPGVTNSRLPVVQMRSPTSKRPAFHPQPAEPAGPDWPEVTTVFCGPAQYKVTATLHTQHSTLNTPYSTLHTQHRSFFARFAILIVNTAACLLILQYSTLNAAASLLLLPAAQGSDWN